MSPSRDAPPLRPAGQILIEEIREAIAKLQNCGTNDPAWFLATGCFATSRPSVPGHARARREKTTLDRYLCSRCQSRFYRWAPRPTRLSARYAGHDPPRPRIRRSRAHRRQSRAARRLTCEAGGRLSFLPSPLKAFLDPQIRAAAEKQVEVRFDLTFTEGLAMDSDAPEKLTEQLTRLATGAAYVEALAEAKS